MSKHLVQSTETQYVDEETGQLIVTTTSKTHKIKVTEDNFFMTYITLLQPLYQLEHLADMKLIVKFCELAEFNTGKVSLSTARRGEICEELELSTSNFSKYIKRLKDKQLITGDKGEYEINPDIFWKGDRKSRAAILKDKGLNMTFSFEYDGDSKGKE